MSWEALAAGTAVICAVATLLSSWSALSVRASIEKMRADMAEARSKDREELRAWINGSFLRSATALAEMKAFEIRMDHLERDLNA
ncbi:hypothetical protein UFOVP130_21 [uncultured Caudovirales phage]|uniref:Uncharacterized protein n=1 Tax=uncultured Caudovirales phage TaxID=2100421 RepID=A0A6J5LAZ6_9CAUD|nr:hypothetical protein UFOVP130_21 [uncultured Caudovirales phage]